MKHIDIYTDGACSVNPGPGGWCAILIYNKIEKVISGAIPSTTNNRMELFAILSGLRALKERCEVTIYSDSSYCINPFTLGWLGKWQANNWQKGTKGADSDVKNKDLWQALIAEVNKHEVSFVQVKGHSDNEYNNRCDAIAVNETKKLIKAQQ